MWVVVLSEPNYAGNIIVILANLPDFLRTPILKKRMLEFFSMSDSDKIEIISNALEAGPTIPFLNFSKLFKTWLEVLTTISEEQRGLMFSAYVNQITVENLQELVDLRFDIGYVARIQFETAIDIYRVPTSDRQIIEMLRSK